MSKIDAFDEQYRVRPSLPEPLESELLGEILKYASDLSARQREGFAAIESAEGRRTVIDLFPDFTRGGLVHKDLQALRDRRFVRPAEGGNWQPDKHPIVTRFAGLIQTIKPDAMKINALKQAPDVGG